MKQPPPALRRIPMVPSQRQLRGPEPKLVPASEPALAGGTASLRRAGGVC